jgi:hypothetical protein
MTAAELGGIGLLDEQGQAVAGEAIPACASCSTASMGAYPC